MPIISQFYGIIIQMFFNENQKHYKEHIHVRYNEYEVVYDLDGNILEGDLPVKQKKLVEAWIAIHQNDLKNLWNTMQNYGKMFKIDPLK